MGAKLLDRFTPASPPRRPLSIRLNFNETGDPLAIIINRQGPNRGTNYQAQIELYEPWFVRSHGFKAGKTSNLAVAF